MAEARRRGVAPHRLVPWVRRQLGGGMIVLRFRSDGSPGCSAPCELCARELERFGLRVTCLRPGGEGWFSGRLGEEGAPAAKPTNRQARELQLRGGRRQQQQQQRAQPQWPAEEAAVQRQKGSSSVAALQQLHNQQQGGSGVAASALGVAPARRRRGWRVHD